MALQISDPLLGHTGETGPTGDVAQVVTVQIVRTVHSARTVVLVITVSAKRTTHSLLSRWPFHPTKLTPRRHSARHRKLFGCWPSTEMSPPESHPLLLPTASCLYTCKLVTSLHLQLVSVSLRLLVRSPNDNRSPVRSHQFVMKCWWNGNEILTSDLVVFHSATSCQRNNQSTKVWNRAEKSAKTQV